MKWRAKEVDDHWIEFTLIGDNIEIHCLNYGGIITKIVVPDKNGKMENVVLGYKNVQDYKKDTHFLGALIGRVGGRIPNAEFQQNGQMFSLVANEGSHHLHGGPNGFHQIVWKSEVFQNEHEVGVKLKHTSKAGADGYPGDVEMTVYYRLKKDRTFTITYEAIATKDTILSPTNHMYFNLSGDIQIPIHQHMVTTDCDRLLEVDQELLPTNLCLPVKETPFDFRNGKMLESGIASNHPQNEIVGNGYDHYLLFAKEKAIHVSEPLSGRELVITTTEPGFVLYSANRLEEGLAFQGGPSKAYQGVCFETQTHPASLLNRTLPSVRLHANKKYKQQTTYAFTEKRPGHKYFIKGKSE